MAHQGIAVVGDVIVFSLGLCLVQQHLVAVSPNSGVLELTKNINAKLSSGFKNKKKTINLEKKSSWDEAAEVSVLFPLMHLLTVLHYQLWWRTVGLQH